MPDSDKPKKSPASNPSTPPPAEPKPPDEIETVDEADVTDEANGNVDEDVTKATVSDAANGDALAGVAKIAPGKPTPPGEWNPLRSFVVAAGVIGLLSFCFSTNLLLYRFSSQPQIVLQPADQSSGEGGQEKQSREIMTAQAQLVADIDQRQRAMQVQGMEKGLGIIAGTALIFFGGILLSLLFAETLGQHGSGSNFARAASPGAALMLAGALLIGWSTSKNVDKLPSFTSSPAFKFFAEP